MKEYKKILAILLSVALVSSLFCGCANTEAKNEVKTEAKSEVNEVKSEAKAEVKTEDPQIIMRTGELTTMAPLPDSEEGQYPTVYYDDLNSMILAYKSGKIESMYALPFVVAKYVENHIEGVKAVEPQMTTGTIGLCIGTLKENTEIYNLFNNAIDNLLNNGTIKKLQDEYLDKYLRAKEEPKPVDMPKIDGAKTIKIAITGNMPPIDFVAVDGRPAGFNIALLSEISKLTNTNIELVQMNNGARLAALKTNTVDAVFHNSQFKFDNKEYDEILSMEDLPDEISITKPYYTSRIYEVDSIKKLDELAAKGIIMKQKNTQSEIQFISGMLSCASITEEEENDKMKQYGWDIEAKFFDSLNQMVLALKSGQIDNIASLPKSTAEYIRAHNNDVIIIKSPGNSKIQYNMATLEDNKEVFNILNDMLNDIIKDGTIKNIENEYIDEFIENKEEPKTMDMPHFEGANTIKVAVTGDLPPFDFVSVDGKPAGYNVALLSEIANRAKVNIELVTMNQGARTTALSTKNIDAIFWISNYGFIDERNKVYDCPKGVVLTDCYYEDDAYNVCPRDGKVDKLVNTNNEIKNGESKVKMRTGELTTMISDAKYNDDETYPTTLFDDLNSLIMAFNADKVDSIYGLPDVVSKYISNQIDGTEVVLPTDYLGTLDLSMAVLKENNETLDLFNDAIDKLTNDGTLDSLKKSYLEDYKITQKEYRKLPHFDGAKTIKVAVTGNLPPIDYVSADGTPAGFAVALLSEIAKCENINIELITVNAATRLIALKEKTADVVFCVTKYSYDNNKYKEVENLDIPDEIAITKPYYISKVTKVVHSKLAEEHKLNVVQNNKKEKRRMGMLPLLNISEEEENALFKDWNYEIKYYDDINSMLLALESDKIDNITLLPESTARYVASHNDNFEIRKTALTEDDKLRYYMATLESNKEVYNMINDSLNEIINDGTIKKLESQYIDVYIDNEKGPQSLELPHFDGAKTIKVAVTGDLPPFDFVSVDGRPAGYNVALLSEIANRIKVNIELVPMNAGARATALSSGNVDVIFWICGVPLDKTRNTRDDCPKGVIITEFYYEAPTYLVYKKK